MGNESFFGRNMVGQEEWARRGEAVTAAATAVSAALPVGVIAAYYGTAAPTGWLLCDGAAIPAAYTTLIALVGPNTPNLKGRVLVGLDATQTEFDTLGETGGSKTAVASHSHTVGTHNHGGSTQTENSHLHGFTSDTQIGTHTHGVNAGLGGGDVGLTAGASLYNILEQLKTTSSDSAPHQHSGTSGAGSVHGHSLLNGTAPAVGPDGTASGNLTPYIAIPYIIKAV